MTVKFSETQNHGVHVVGANSLFLIKQIVVLIQDLGFVCCTYSVDPNTSVFNQIIQCKLTLSYVILGRTVC